MSHASLAAPRFDRGVALVVAVLGGWTHLWGREAVPETTSHELDISELRRLASSLPGERPIRVNHEQISTHPPDRA